VLKVESKSPLPPFELVGVGVRTVSFLGIKVYSVGFYADLANPKLKVRLLDVKLIATFPWIGVCPDPP
jgi:hypothetical protein